MNQLVEDLLARATMKTYMNRGSIVARELPERIRSLSGWRGATATMALGAFAATALPPVHFLPAVFAFAALAWRLDGELRPRQAATIAWQFAFGFHVAGLYWISNALLVDSERFAWLVPFAALGLPLVLALFTATAFAALPILCAPGWARAFAVPVLWGLADYARGHLFTGLPWNLPAYVLSGSDSMGQGAAWFGAYGLSLLVMVVGVGPALVCGPVRRPPGLAILSAGLCCAVPLMLWGFGSVRLMTEDTVRAADVVIRIVQANIAQKDKWKRDLRASHLRKYRTFSMSLAPDRQAAGLPSGAVPTVVIWPETAVPAYLVSDPDLRRALAPTVPSGGSLVTGAPTLDERNRRLYNSMIVMGHDGSVLARYDKSHLVPFGEYVPFRSWLPLPRIAQSFIDFAAGPGRRTLEIPGLGAASPLICYEIIFPGSVVAAAPPRPLVLLNLTNDAWFGRSSGPYQHRAIARMRAIEEGLPLIRVSGTGISGVYDAFGRVVVEISLGVAATADSYLPGPVAEGTAYSRSGDMMFFALHAVFIALLMLPLLLRRRPVSARR